MSAPPPGLDEPRYFARPAVATFVVLFAMAAGWVVLPSTLVAVMASLGIGTGMAGSLFFVAFSGYMLASVGGGMIADRLGRRLVLTAGIGGLSVCLALFASISHYYLAVPFVLLIGLGVGLTEGQASALLVDLFPKRSHAAVTIGQIFFSLGAVLSPLLAGAVLSRGASWRWVFAATALVCVGAAVSFALGTRSLPRRPATAPSSRRAGGGSPSVLFRHADFRLLALAMFLYVCTETTVSSWLTTHLQRLAAPALWAGGALSGFWLATALGRVVIAWLTHGARPRWLQTGSALLGCAAMLALALTDDYRLAFAAGMLAGLAFSGIWGLLVADAGGLFPAQVGTATGVMVAIGALGGVVFPPIVGVLARYAGLGLGFALGSVPILAVAALVFRLEHRQRPPGPPGRTRKQGTWP